MKKTLYALIFGLSSVIGCDDFGYPVETHRGKKEIYIPNECKEVKSLSVEYEGLNLTCVNNLGETVFYITRNKNMDSKWIKYTIIREDKK